MGAVLGIVPFMLSASNGASRKGENKFFPVENV